MGIGFSNALRSTPVLQIAFEPSIGITARRIDKLGENIRSFRAPLELAIREVMRPSIRQNFAVGGRPQWEALSETTLQRRMFSGSGTQILRVTGKLARVAQQRNIWDIGMTSAVIKGFAFVEGKAGYGAFHQTGTGKGLSFTSSKNERGKTIFVSKDVMPARPFLMIQEEDKEKIRQIFLEWLEMRVARDWSAVV